MTPRKPTFCNHAGPKKASWKFNCPVAIKQEDDACLATAITHAVMCDSPLKGDSLERMAIVKALRLDHRLNTHKGGHRQDILKAVDVAIDLGYARHSVPIETFEQYKHYIVDFPVVIGFDQFEGMAIPSSGGFIGPSGRRLPTKHAMVLLGRNKGWRWWPLSGRYSVIKNSGGSDWGYQHGEAFITDGDLKKLFEIGNVQAVAVVK